MLIGLAGRAGAGKDTVAQMIVQAAGAVGYPAIVTSFADPLYEAVSAITGIPVNRLRDRELKEQPIEWLGKSPRELLQTLGTQWGRQMIHPEIWVAATARRWRGSDAAVIAIPDVRFDNEARAIREAGGRVFRVIRPGHECLAAGAAQHESEAGVSDDLVDGVIANVGTLEQLRERVHRSIMQE